MHQFRSNPAGRHPPQTTLFSAPLWAARQRAAEQGHMLVVGLVAMAQPSGTTTRAAFEALRDELLKSSQHFYASFAKIAKAVIYMAAPGSVRQDLTRQPYRKVERPRWPLLD